ncbi:MAG TPA: PstA family ABC transporter permease [Acidimicrobiales bacterium]|nr:PstA family ABC transporter permease [Acidimicrobiales bacterium]
MATVTNAYPSTRSRRVRELFFKGMSVAALIFVIGPSLWLIADVVIRAVPHWQWNVLTTVPVGVGGGLENAILGTLVIMVGVLLIAGTVGILTGIHFAELQRPRRNGRAGGNFLRTATEVLAGFPSIVLGYVGYIALCVGLHWGFSLLPALIVLSIMVTPYIAKSTESALRQVPTNYREGAEALGMAAGYALRKVVIKSALPGIVTGLLIALAIAVGETAPLLYTAGITNNLPSASLIHQPIAYLTYYVWTDYNQPINATRYLSYDAALILIVLVLALLVSSRLLVNRTQRYSEGRR